MCSTINVYIYLIQSGTAGATFSMTSPITKVVKNEAYMCPPVPVAPTRPNANLAVARSSAAAALQPVSRTLQQCTAETSAAAAPTPPQVIP